jgi:D-alanine-D-alanine ligase
MPAPIPQAAYDEACDIALRAHRALGCRGVSRADLRYDDTMVAGGKPGRFYLLEVNTQPGMTPTSLVPDIAKYCGISFVDLVSWMVENARCDA